MFTVLDEFFYTRHIPGGPYLYTVDTNNNMPSVVDSWEKLIILNSLWCNTRLYNNYATIAGRVTSAVTRVHRGVLYTYIPLYNTRFYPSGDDTAKVRARERLKLMPQSITRKVPRTELVCRRVDDDVIFQRM